MNIQKYEHMDIFNNDGISGIGQNQLFILRALID